MFQGYRALLPILALYLCLMWILTRKPSFPFSRSPLGFLICYFMVGLVSSLCRAAEFVALLIVVWFILDKKDPAKFLKRFLHVNYAVIVLITISILPDAYRFGFSRVEQNMYYNLLFKLG